jgi:hypothetical protein
VTVEDEFDEEEFESISKTDTKDGGNILPNLEIKESAVRIKPIWEAYFVEICISLGIVLYLINYLMGRVKNSNLAEQWLITNLPTLQNEFTIAGDDGEGEEPNQARIVKRSENSFTVWCSGRVNCDSLLVHLELMKRHDMISIATNLFHPTPDTVSFIFQLSEHDMDCIVLAVTQRKSANKLAKDYADLANYCSGIRSGERHGLPSSLSILSETYDCATAVLSGGVAKYLSSSADDLVCLHISDSYTGLKEETEESDTVVIKKGEKRIHLTFKMSGDSTGQLVFALKLLDHVRSIKLSREAKDKAVKNRQKVAQTQEKLQHQQRQEAAQQRKEEKLKAEKEKMLNETDVEKARKWEEKEHKRQLKKNQPKMKQMKMKVG